MTALYSELGAAYNGWSLTETMLSEAIEATGQAIDSSVTATMSLSHVLEECFGEPLKVYSQLSGVIAKVLAFRHKTHVQFESISEGLIAKQVLLTKLETAEHESQRLTAVLQQEGIGPAVPLPRPTGIMATFNSLLDNDPELTRRNQISKTKESIVSLEEEREKVRQDLIKTNMEIQTELARFQTQKLVDLRNVFLQFALAQKEYHVKSLNAWNLAKKSVD